MNKGMFFWRIKTSFFNFICIVGGGVQTASTRHVGHLLAYCTCPGWLWEWRIWWNEWQGKPKYSEKTCHDATLSTTNPTWPDPGLNPGRRGRKPATNRFSYGATMLFYFSVSQYVQWYPELEPRKNIVSRELNFAHITEEKKNRIIKGL
jgi:hypothetical protein